MCKVSVIIPSFNAAEYLPELLGGLCAQTLQDIEILLVDDGSTDDTRRIAEELAAGDARIKYLHQENAGAGAARNNGLDHAAGEYVICLDSDDCYDADLLEKLYGAAAGCGADAAMCLFRRHNYWLNTEDKDVGFNKQMLPLDQPFCPADIEDFCSAFNPGPINKMYRREFVEEHGLRYSTTHVANDVFFGYAAMLSAKTVYCMSENLLTVRRYYNANSISSNRGAHLPDTIAVFRQLYDWMYANGLEDRYAEQLRHQLVSGFGYNSQYGWNEEYWKALCDILEQKPWRELTVVQLRQQFRCGATPLNNMQHRLDSLKQKAAGQPKGSHEKAAAENEVTMYASRLDYTKRLEAHLNELARRRGELPKEEGRLKRWLKKFAPASRRNIADQTREITELNKRETRQLLRQGEQVLAGNRQLLAAVTQQHEEAKVSLEKTQLRLEALQTELVATRKAQQEMKKQLDWIKAHVAKTERAGNEGVWGQVFNQAVRPDSWLTDTTFFPGRYAAGYNMLYVLYRCLDEAGPKNILDIGLGQTSRMISAYVTANPGTKHTVVENNRSWIDFYRQRFPMSAGSEILCLETENVPFRDAENVRMYQGFAAALAGKKFDLIIVDAPFGGDMEQLSRVDLLTILPGCLEKSFVLLLDDEHRKPEQNTAELIRACLRENGIAFREGAYRGNADLLAICSEDRSYFCTL